MCGFGKLTLFFTGFYAILTESSGVVYQINAIQQAGTNSYELCFFEKNKNISTP